VGAWVGFARFRRECRENPEAAKAVVVLLCGKQEQKVNADEVRRS
jgi:hypothetical protein